jgi:hypothetical protein
VVLAGLGIAVAAKAASLSLWWIAAPVIAGGIVLLAIGGSGALRTLKRVWDGIRRRRALRRSWWAFCREVEERTWLYDPSHTHSLPFLVKNFTRSVAMDQKEKFAMLQADGAGGEALSELYSWIRSSTAKSWPGAHVARVNVQVFESLFVWPLVSAVVRRLNVIQMQPEDRPLVQAWLERYLSSVDSYGRFARDQNQLIGERVYRDLSRSR